jgi:hypothetical protein
MLLVDLAGSERIMKSNSTGQRQVDSAMINNSLTALGRVVQRLAAGDAHVPFRDSTLAMLLRNSLGGSHRTSVVVNMAPEVQHEDETCCALRFGQRMRGVKNATVRNAEKDMVAESAGVSRDLERARRLLGELIEAGQRGQVNGKGNERLMLEQNIWKLHGIEADLATAREQLTEARSRRSSSDVAARESKLRALMEQKVNHGDVVLRQRTIKGLWSPPSHTFLAAQAAVTRLEARCTMLGAR